MAAQIIDGKQVAGIVRDEVRAAVEDFSQLSGRAPGLATVLVGEDAASAVYVAGKQRACTEVGISPRDERLPADVSEERLAELLGELGADAGTDGILLQLPLPSHLDAASMIDLIDPTKDVDGLTPVNAGLLALGQPGIRPCTPLGAMRLIAESGAELEGAEAVVLGRSNLFGKPMAALLLAADATVTSCHSHSRELAQICRRADLLIAAVGRAEMVKGDWVKPGAVVIDVGITRSEPAQPGGPGRLVGDVDFAAAVKVAGAITPVPGGVGPMTIAMLLQNTLQAAQQREGVGVSS